MAQELYFIRKSGPELHSPEFIIKTDDRDEAYAALAALDLLAALRMMVDTFAPDHEGDFHGFALKHFQIARAAIAKAEGRAS